MCGIVGYAGSRDVLPVLLSGLKRLEYRGYDSAGVAVGNGSGLFVRKAAGPLGRLESLLGSKPRAGAYGIGHTRWATHGPPTGRNAHPHVDCTGRIAVIHNGIIENFDPLKEALRKKGHRFISQTDTEVIAHLLEEEWTVDLPSTLRKVCRKLRGSFALVALSTDDPGRIAGVRQGPPLVVGFGRGESFVASDVAALLPYTRDVAFLEDGEVLSATRDGVEVTSLAGRPVSRRPLRVDWSEERAEKGGHPHFFIKEILEQPETFAAALSGRIDPGAGRVLIDDEPGLADVPLGRIRRVMLVACGSAWHAALVAKYWIEELARLPCEAETASEFRYRSPVLGPDTLAIAVSQSGETADTLAGANLARRRGAPLLAVTNSPASLLARTADATILMRAGVEVGVAASKTYTSQLAVLLMVALRLAEERRALPRSRARELLGGLARVPRWMEAALESRRAARRLASRFADARFGNFMFVGRGVNFPTALEGALKLKEISYRHAEGYGAGEMKHGPLALVDRNLPVVGVAVPGPLREKTLSNLREIRARGGRLAIVAPPGDREARKLAEAHLDVPEVPERLSPMVAAIPLQLFAYELAAMLGRDVDKPRNLAKSVTVE